MSLCCISVSFRLLATAVSLKVSPPGPVWKEWVKSPRISPSSCRQRHPPITDVSENHCRLLHSKHQEPASFATGSVLLPARENRPTAIQVTITARSDDHPHHSTQTSLFFSAPQACKQKKRIISKKKTSPKQKSKKFRVTSVSSICNFEFELPKNQPNP